MSRPPVIVRLQGGMGNQLYEYAVGRAVALRLGRPMYLETMRILAEPLRHYALGVFRIQENLVPPALKWTTRWAGSVRLGRAFRTLCPLAWGWEILQDREAGFDPSIFRQRRGAIVLSGYWQSHRYFEEHRELLLKEFALREAPNDANRRMIERMNEVDSVSVHVRRGDYVANPAANAIHGTCSLDYYRQAVEEIARRVTNPHYFVFTDDPAWARQNLKLPGPMTVVDHNLGKADHEDLRLMTHCRHFVIANSSFSWWGAWLAQHPGKIVIAPRKWFNVDAIPPEDRIPASWTRI